MRRVVAMACSIFVTGAAVAQTVTMPPAAETGSTYRDLDATTRGWYIRGLVDGYLGAAQFGGDENLVAAFAKCLNGMTSIEIEALVDKYLADHPAQLHKGMHALAANAITDSCPEYSKDLMKSDFWRRTLEQSKPPK
jgi:hypothetical protein